MCVAGTAIESARLLLLSDSPQHPDGLANSSGQVGCNYMRHLTGSVYAEFDRREGAEGFEERRVRLLDALGAATRPPDFAALPANDLASSPHARWLLELGAFRADVSGAGPVIYGLFVHRAQAAAAERELRAFGRTWITVPTWYG